MSTKTLTVGLRDFHAEGNQFILNGRPINFRGTHSGGDFPLTGYPPTDVKSWLRAVRDLQEVGSRTTCAFIRGARRKQRLKPPIRSGFICSPSRACGTRSVPARRWSKCSTKKPIE